MPKIAFLHLDLGIGGAERLVVDAALGLKKNGHTVNIVTTHHDKSHAFEETVNGDISVVVVGNWIPRTLFNRFHALMAYIRIIYAAIYLILFSNYTPDVVFCDVVSVAIPILNLRIRHVVFYCHFPDQLLSQPGGFFKTLYRAPINWLEEVSLNKAAHIFVNSNFTARIFKQTFKRISKTPDILYPSLNMAHFDSSNESTLPGQLEGILNQNKIIFLSINRYERKKNLPLALKAFSELKELVSDELYEKVHLVLAGGYDHRINENVQHFEELTQLSSELNLNNRVTLLKSLTDVEKISLIKLCISLIYTPSNEHFGIVPIEAMYLSKPVIAVNSGGPMETIVHDETGFLCLPSSSSFANAMSKFLIDKNLPKKFGTAGRKRVSKLFSFDKFASNLNNIIIDLLKEKRI